MQGKLLNIPSYVQDPSYKYQMPELQLKIEGKGSGIKTNILNLAEVAKILRVPIEYPLKFLGYELSAQTFLRYKENIFITMINGSYKMDELRKILDIFIEKYVLCPSCKLPEIKMEVKVEKIIKLCYSCGIDSGLDDTHKLNKFILKNPKQNDWDYKED